VAIADPARRPDVLADFVTSLRHWNPYVHIDSLDLSMQDDQVISLRLRSAVVQMSHARKTYSVGYVAVLTLTDTWQTPDLKHRLERSQAPPRFEKM
jgi:hypothetical protein